MSVRARLSFVVVIACAAAGCDSRANNLVLPDDSAAPAMNTGPALADSSAAARGPGLAGSGN
jgi:hypothetical protein